MSRLLDAIILAANVGLFVVLVWFCAEGYRFQRVRLAVWDERAPWLGRALGLLQFALNAAIGLGLMWVGYYFTGFPMWMRWLAG